jgi:hypothetical protein
MQGQRKAGTTGAKGPKSNLTKTGTGKFTVLNSTYSNIPAKQHSTGKK